MLKSTDFDKKYKHHQTLHKNTEVVFNEVMNDISKTLSETLKSLDAQEKQQIHVQKGVINKQRQDI